jgi:hypothetical protein
MRYDMWIDNLAGTLGAVVGLCVIVAYIVGVIWLAHWMLEPINRAAGQLQAQTRFLLTDVFGLMALVQIALAITGGAIDERQDSRPYWAMVFVSLFLSAVLWAASVSVVSRAGILQPLRRLAVIVLLVPGSLAIIMSLPLIVVFVGIGFDRGSINLSFWRWVVFAPLCVGGLIGLIIAARRLSYWTMVGSTYSVARSANLPPAGV